MLLFCSDSLQEVAWVVYIFSTLQGLYSTRQSNAEIINALEGQRSDGI